MSWLTKGQHLGVLNARFATIACLTASVLFLGACREEEQDRFIMFEPGVYKGKPDDTLSTAESEEMRNRTVLQAGANLGTGAVGKVAGDIRPPEPTE